MVTTIVAISFYGFLMVWKVSEENTIVKHSLDHSFLRGGCYLMDIGVRFHMFLS